MLKNNELLLNVHIEKAGGTTVQNFVANNLFHPEEVLLYTRHTDQFIRVSEDPTHSTTSTKDSLRYLIRMFSPYIPLVFATAQRFAHFRKSSVAKNYNSHEIPNDIRAITGHFVADQFEKPINCLPKKVGSRSVVLREPLERAVSHFHIWNDSKGRFRSRINIPYSEEMTMKDFCLLPELADFQSRSLGSLGLDDFETVGITEDLDKFMSQLALNIAGRPIEGSSHRFNARPSNRSSQEADLYTDRGFLAKFMSANANDYAIYEIAQHRVKVI